MSHTRRPVGALYVPSIHHCASQFLTCYVFCGQYYNCLVANASISEHVALFLNSAVWFGHFFQLNSLISNGEIRNNFNNVSNVSLRVSFTSCRWAQKASGRSVLLLQYWWQGQCCYMLLTWSSLMTEIATNNIVSLLWFGPLNNRLKTALGNSLQYNPILHLTRQRFSI